jgi:hypothetical protein
VRRSFRPAARPCMHATAASSRRRAGRPASSATLRVCMHAMRLSCVVRGSHRSGRRCLTDLLMTQRGKERGPCKRPLHVRTCGRVPNSTTAMHLVEIVDCAVYLLFFCFSSGTARSDNNEVRDNCILFRSLSYLTLMMTSNRETLNYKIVDLVESYNFHIKCTSIRVYAKSYNFVNIN